jgi:hypothetical protein
MNDHCCSQEPPVSGSRASLAQKKLTHASEIVTVASKKRLPPTVCGESFESANPRLNRMQVLKSRSRSTRVVYM